MTTASPALALGAAAILSLLLATPPTFADPVTIRAAPLVLDPAHPERAEVGRLTYLAGFVLTAADGRFGGYSGLALVENGERMIAVSDLGHWLTASLRHDPQGRLSGLEKAEILPLRDPDSRPVSGKRLGDAEAVAVAADGSLLVAFERAHRVWRYRAGPDGPAEALGAPTDLARLPRNGGIEALASLPDGRLLLIAEDSPDGGSQRPAWIGRPGAWTALSYLAADGFAATDAAALPDGGVVVLERRFRPLEGVTARVRRLPAAAIAAATSGSRLDGELLAELAFPLPVDNMEGIAVGRKADGSLLLYLISDDNQNPLQRTLLMQFRLNP